MTPSSLPPQGRYADPRIQQLVLDELSRKDIAADKFYFTSDDWLVSYDGQVPAWNSVFGVAPYRKDGQTYYAECGVSQRYDPHTAQWGEPAATVKEGLPLSESDFEAAPSALATASAASSSPATAADQAPAEPAGQSAPGDAPAGRSEPGTEVRSFEADAAAKAADAAAHPEGGAVAHPAGGAAEVPSFEADAAAKAAVQAGERGIDRTNPGGGGSAIYGGDAINTPDPGTDRRDAERRADLAGYALTVREDGTAELQVPPGGQVTLRWSGH